MPIKHFKTEGGKILNLEIWNKFILLFNKNAYEPKVQVKTFTNNLILAPI